MTWTKVLFCTVLPAARSSATRRSWPETYAGSLHSIGYVFSPIREPTQTPVDPPRKVFRSITLSSAPKRRWNQRSGRLFTNSPQFV
jgi:hypothetical protein